MRLPTLFPALLAVTLATAPALHAQGLFTPQVYVDNTAITRYEVQQRAAFIKSIGGAGDAEAAAIDALIEDRLYQVAAKKLKVAVTDAQVDRGIAEFAARAKLSPEAFLAQMAADGVSRETVRDFVRSGVLWREVVRAKYAGRVTVTDAEIDRVMSAEANRPGQEIALSEIILPMIPQYRDQSLQIAALIEQEVHDPAMFAEAAQRFSAAPSRDRGGALEWMPATNMPPRIAQAVKGLKPGQRTERIEVPNAIAYFLLRGERQASRPAASSLMVDYARLTVPGEREAALARAGEIIAATETCEDLNVPARDLPPGSLSRQRQAFGTVPADIGLELARLDTNETALATGPAGEVVIYMLCSRQENIVSPPSRDQVRSQLLDQRLGALARGYLAELRADAIIRRP